MSKKILNRINKKRNNKSIANQFEEFVATQCRSDKFEGKTDIFKEVDSHKYRKKLHVDFIGWTRVFDNKIIKNDDGSPSVLPVGVECKTIASDVFEFRLLKEHQLNYLKRLAHVGGVALILIEFRKRDKIVRVHLQKENIIKPKANTFLYYIEHNKTISYKNIINLYDVKIFNMGQLPFDFIGGGVNEFPDIVSNNLLTF